MYSLKSCTRSAFLLLVCHLSVLTATNPSGSSSKLFFPSNSSQGGHQPFPDQVRPQRKLLLPAPLYVRSVGSRDYTKLSERVLIVMASPTRQTSGPQQGSEFASLPCPFQPAHQSLPGCNSIRGRVIHLTWSPSHLSVFLTFCCLNPALIPSGCTSARIARPHTQVLATMRVW